ncbi:nitroreductase family deazaflavin-dependent oxidoreductase [Nonomuraea pusilla]|uniref:nitroreductase family deazaflavin-dependent oxidoreductase n=1 Tax=Nonomuraea pusilla TaxID=46177 RepID=UPI003321DEE1
MARYIEPTRMDHLFNRMVAGLTRLGISLWGSRILYVRGRSSGEWRTTPVNVLSLNGSRYLVAPRGITQWVRNLRAAGNGELHVGRRIETFTAAELSDDEKPAILRAYLKRWGWEVGRFFEGVNTSASEEQVKAVAPGFPVFRIN